MALRVFSAKTRRVQAAVIAVLAVVCLTTGTTGGAIFGLIFAGCAIGCWRKSKIIRDSDTLIIGNHS